MLLTNLQAATMTGGYGIVAKAAVMIENGRIAWVGPAAEAPSGSAIDCGGRLLTPGLIDCHTHLVYGGNRANEFELRLTGVPYAEIAKAGGGIAATVRATRTESGSQLASVRIKATRYLAGRGHYDRRDKVGLRS